MIDGSLCQLTREGVHAAAHAPLATAVAEFCRGPRCFYVREHPHGLLPGIPNLYCLDRELRLQWLAEWPLADDPCAAITQVEDDVLTVTDADADTVEEPVTLGLDDTEGAGDRLPDRDTVEGLDADAPRLSDDVAEDDKLLDADRLAPADVDDAAVTDAHFKQVAGPALRHRLEKSVRRGFRGGRPGANRRGARAEPAGQVRVDMPISDAADHWRQA